jgi:hypothetical protein
LKRKGCGAHHKTGQELLRAALRLARVLQWACIAKKTRRHDFPADKDYAGKVYTHNLDQLLKVAHLDAQLDSDMNTRPQLANNWDLVRRWKVDCRYETSNLGGGDLSLAVNSADGVLQWIKLRW